MFQLSSKRFVLVSCYSASIYKMWALPFAKLVVIVVSTAIDCHLLHNLLQLKIVLLWEYCAVYTVGSIPVQ